MSVSFPKMRNGKASRDAILKDVIMRDQPARPVGVAAGTIIGPDEILVVNTTSPLTVRPAVSGEPVTPGTTLAGVSVGYSTATATVAGEVMYYLHTEEQTARVEVQGPAPVVGGRYALITTVDANGYTVQKLDTSAVVATSNLMVDEYDAVSNKAAVQIL